MRTIRLSKPSEFASLVKTHIEHVASSHSREIRIGLPGGRGSVPVVHGIASIKREFLPRIELYLVDERLSGSTNKKTLLEVGLQELIDLGVFKESQLHIPQKEGEFFDFEGELDLLYLGVGEDGHFASLFPGSYPKLDHKECKATTYIDNSPKEPPQRVTVTYRGFSKHAKKTNLFILFFGEGKRGAYERFLHQKENPSTLPVAFFARELFNLTIVTDL